MKFVRCTGRKAKVLLWLARRVYSTNNGADKECYLWLPHKQRANSSIVSLALKNSEFSKAVTVSMRFKSKKCDQD